MFSLWTFPISHPFFSISLSLQGGGKSQELTAITSAQIQNATENGDKFKMNDRDISQVTHIM